MNAQNMNTTDISAESIVEALGLKSHPEGGWYIETYNNTPEDGSRGTLSVIYYLLEKGQSAHWHRVVDADEVWLWHGGAPLNLYQRSSDGAVVKNVLGMDAGNGQTPQVIIPKGMWQSASATDGWSLVSCVVGPAFVFDKMEFAPRGFEPGFGI